MYLGSVKFYKHLIYITIMAILVLAVVGLIFLIGLIIPDSSVDAANINSMNNTSYNQAKGNNSNVKESSDSQTKKSDPGIADDVDNQASSESDGNLEDAASQANVENSEEPEAFELYPDLHCEKSDIKDNDKKTAYLTFDDGPSSGTEKILSLLDEHDIKATFFVVTGGANSSNLHLLKQIDEAGHSIGIHSHTHIYKEIYDSKESFLEEMNNAFNIIYEATNKKPTVFRFPGGSVNDINAGIYEDITTEVLNRNFRFYDWNVSFEDAKSGITADEIYQSALDGIEKNSENDLIILAHDRADSSNTLEALEKVIDVLEANGYSFDKLDNSVEPITFSYK